MNRCFQIRRIRGAAFLILIGVLALLNQEHILSWGRSWPLFLILAGVLLLLERAAWAADVRDHQLMTNTAEYPATPAPSSPAAGTTPPVDDPYREVR